MKEGELEKLVDELEKKVKGTENSPHSQDSKTTDSDATTDSKSTPALELSQPSATEAPIDWSKLVLPKPISLKPSFQLNRPDEYIPPKSILATINEKWEDRDKLIKPSYVDLSKRTIPKPNFPSTSPLSNLIDPNLKHFSSFTESSQPSIEKKGYLAIEYIVRESAKRDGEQTSPAGSGKNKILLYDPAKKETVEVGFGRIPRWSPDGKHLAFVETTEGHLVVYDGSKTDAKIKFGINSEVHCLGWCDNDSLIAMISAKKDKDTDKDDGISACLVYHIFLDKSPSNNIKTCYLANQKLGSVQISDSGTLLYQSGNGIEILRPDGSFRNFEGENRPILSPDGKQFVSITGNLSREERAITITDITSGECSWPNFEIATQSDVQEYPLDGTVLWSSDGKKMIVRTGKGKTHEGHYLLLLDTDVGQIRKLPDSGTINMKTASWADADTIFYSGDKQVTSYDLNSGWKKVLYTANAGVHVISARLQPK